MEIIGNYEYYSEHGFVIFVQHSCAIAFESINHHIERNLRNLTEALKKEKKDAYFAMIRQIRDILLPFAIVAKNISFWLFIPLFLSLGTLLPTYHCICTANCHFALCLYALNVQCIDISRRFIWRKNSFMNKNHV